MARPCLLSARSSAFGHSCSFSFLLSTRKVLSAGLRAGLLFAAQHSPGHCFPCPDHHQAGRQDAQAAPGCCLGDEYSGGYCRLDICYNVFAEAVISFNGPQKSPKGRHSCWPGRAVRIYAVILRSEATKNPVNRTRSVTIRDPSLALRMTACFGILRSHLAAIALSGPASRRPGLDVVGSGRGAVTEGW